MCNKENLKRFTENVPRFFKIYRLVVDSDLGTLDNENI